MVAPGHTDSAASYVSSFGSTTMIIEFRNSTTDAALLRYVVSRSEVMEQSDGELRIPTAE